MYKHDIRKAAPNRRDDIEEGWNDVDHGDIYDFTGIPKATDPWERT